jgi:lysozyme
MKPRHQVSRAAVDLIKRFEGYRMKAAQLPDGRWTLGYGHTLTARQGATVSEQDAEALLLYDLITVAHAVNEHSYTPLNQNQFDSLVCFAFNIGVENFMRSGVLRRVNEGSLLQAACAMEMWRKADFEGERIVIDALVRRRAAEKTLFLTPTDGHWVAAPSPILRPKVDYDASCAVPKQTPTTLTSPMEGERAIALREEGGFIRPAPVHDEVVSESEKAAAAVGARLEAILPDAPPAPAQTVVAAPVQDLVLPEPPAEPAPTFTLDETPSAAPFSLTGSPGDSPFRLAPEPESAESEAFAMPSTAAIAEAATPQPTLFEPVRSDRGGSAFNLDGFSTSSDVDLQPLDIPLIEAEPASFGGISLLVSLGLLGLMLFAGGILWNLSVDSDTGMSPIRLFGYGASVIGAVCFGVSAYLLLRRLGGPDEDDA